MKIGSVVIVIFAILVASSRSPDSGEVPHLIAVGDHNFPPFTYVENGVPAGFDVDLIREMEKKMRIPVEIRLLPWADAVRMIKDGSADILIGVSITEERRKSLDFTERMLTMKSSLFVRRDNVSIHRIEDVIASKEVGVESGDIMARFLRERYEGIRLREFRDQKEAISALADGKIELCVLDYYSGLYHMQKNDLHRIVKIVGAPLLEAHYCFGVRKGNSDLLSKLDTALEDVKNDGTAKRVQDGWFGEGFFRQQRQFKWIACVIGCLSFLALVVIIWNVTLRRSIRLKTREILKGKSELREIEDKFRVAFETSPDAIGISRYTDGVYTDVNSGFTHLFGYLPEEAIGKSSDDLKLWTVDEGRKWLIDALRENGSVRDKEISLRRKDGGIVQVIGSAAKFVTGGEEHIIVVATDVSRLKRTEAELRDLIGEKDTLLCELYHRTKNNMQIISSFLKLQLQFSKNKSLEDIVAEANRRIKSMSLVHQMLVKARNLSRISLGDYFRELVHEVMQSFSVGTGVVAIEYRLEHVEVLLDVAMPCGLIVNELVSNALKYAFPEGRKGRIVIGLKRVGVKTVELSVSDDGIGFASGFDPRDSASLGLTILFSVVEKQLQGIVRYEAGDGLSWFISFDDGKYIERV